MFPTAQVGISWQQTTEDKCTTNRTLDDCVIRGRVLCSRLAVWRLQVYHSIFLSLWATYFIAAWRQYQTQLRHDWGSEGYEESEAQLPSFHGTVEDRWWSPVPKLERDLVKHWYDHSRYTTTVVAIGLMLLGVVSGSGFALFVKAIGVTLSTASGCHECSSIGANATSSDFCRVLGSGSGVS